MMTPEQERSIHEEELHVMRERSRIVSLSRIDEAGRQLPPWEQPEARAAQGFLPRPGSDLAEVWCANDDRPAVVMRMTQRGNEEPEYRALCRDCNWKAQQAAKVKVV